MNGTVTRLRPRGVEATMNEATDTLEEGTPFRVYRWTGPNNLILEELGTLTSKRSKGPNLICLNKVDGTTYTEFQIGDLVESI
jgi:hypothetical protein